MISSYVKTVLLPLVGVVIALAGYAGIKLDAKFDQLHSAEERVSGLESAATKQENELLAVSTRLAEVGGTVGTIERTLLVASTNLTNLSDGSKRLQNTTEHQSDKLEDNGLKVVALQTEAVGVKAQNERNKTHLEALEKQMLHLREELKVAEDDAKRLRQITDVQARILTANVVEIVTLNSNDISGELKLPRRGGGEYKVVFETPTVEKTFKLKYQVDGILHDAYVGADMKGEWIAIQGTNSEYEYTLDNLHLPRPGRNFVSIRIRGTQRLLAPS